MANGAQPSGSAPARNLRELLTVGDQTDETGRLLLEDSASEDAQRSARRGGISMRSATCPYRDTPSRWGGRMNISAYEAVRGDVTGILDGFAWLAQNRDSASPATPGTAERLYEISYLGLTLPLVLFHRATAPYGPHAELPAVVASIFKASRGLFSVAVALRNEGSSPSQQMGPAAVIEFAERHHHFVRRQPQRVCAAPTRLIERTISVILTGEGAEAADSRMPEWVAFPTLWRCFRIQDELSESLSMYRFVVDQIARSAPKTRPDQWFARPVPGSSGTFGQLTEAMLAHTSSAQSQLNRALERADRPETLSFPDLLALL